jgi:hypothetical protein
MCARARTERAARRAPAPQLVQRVVPLRLVQGQVELEAQALELLARRRREAAAAVQPPQVAHPAPQPRRVEHVAGDDARAPRRVENLQLGEHRGPIVVAGVVVAALLRFFVIEAG